MIECAVPVAFHKPQESEGAVGVIVPGLQRADAAEILDIPQGTLTSRLVRGRAALISQLEKVH